MRYARRGGKESKAVCGTYAGYGRHKTLGTPFCRPCRDAAARYERGRVWDEMNGRARMVDATGTGRRLRALKVMGWPWHEIADRIGVSFSNNLARIATQDRVLVSTAAAVKRVYDEMCMTPGPSPRSRTWALRKGWLPPLAWDEATIDDPHALPWQPEGGDGPDVDPVAVERWLRGDDTIRLTPDERLEAIRRAGECEVSRGQLMRRWRMSGSRFQALVREACGQDEAPAAS